MLGELAEGSSRWSGLALAKWAFVRRPNSNHGGFRMKINSQQKEIDPVHRRTGRQCNLEERIQVAIVDWVRLVAPHIIILGRMDLLAAQSRQAQPTAARRSRAKANSRWWKDSSTGGLGLGPDAGHTPSLGRTGAFAHPRSLGGRSRIQCAGVYFTQGHETALRASGNGSRGGGQPARTVVSGSFVPSSRAGKGSTRRPAEENSRGDSKPPPLPHRLPPRRPARRPRNQDAHTSRHAIPGHASQRRRASHRLQRRRGQNRHGPRTSRWRVKPAH